MNNLVEIDIQNIKKSFNPKEAKKFRASFEMLTDKYALENKQLKDVEIDDFCIECINLFYIEGVGLPKKLYKGLGRKDIENVLQNLMRSCKTYIIEFCNENKNIRLNDLKDGIRETIISEIVNYICLKSGVDDFISKLYVYSVVQYCRIMALEKICDAL